MKRTTSLRPLAGPEQGRTSASDMPTWLGITLLTAIVVALGLSWMSDFWGPLGDNHEGRILARFALNAQNVVTKGFSGGAFGADMSPTGGVYAHHPPLPNWMFVFSYQLPIEHEAGLRVVSYLRGIATIPALAFLLRQWQVRWVAIVPALGVMAVTTHFWVYGRVIGGVAIPIAALAMVLYVRQKDTVTRRDGVLAALLLAASAMWSWIGVAIAGATCAWLLWDRRDVLLKERRADRLALFAALGGLAGLFVTLTWVIGHHGLEAMVDQVIHRSGSGGGRASTSIGDLIRRQVRWMPTLLPNWWFLLFPLGLVAGVVHRRMRWVSLMTSVGAIGYVVLLRQGAVVHDYWTFPLLTAGAIGMAGMFDLAADELSPRLTMTVATLSVVALLALHLPGIAGGAAAQDLHVKPRVAGELAREHAPPPSQERAWVVAGIPTPRWISWYWDANWQGLTTLDEPTANDDDLILIRIKRAPDWFTDAMLDVLIEERGRYGVARIGDLRAVASAANQ